MELQRQLAESVLSYVDRIEFRLSGWATSTVIAAPSQLPNIVAVVFNSYQWLP